MCAKGQPGSICRIYIFERVLCMRVKKKKSKER